MSDLPATILPFERTLDGTLGTEILEVGEDFVRGRIVVADRIRQAYGIVHGGVMSSLAESLTSMGTARGVMADGKVAMGQEINASFMRPISSGHVNARARVRRKGRTTWNWEVEITDDDGRLCALLRTTIAVRDVPERSPPSKASANPENHEIGH
jgi:1,4-dihydroxy-2-naphthoyl-CoA hydrolase